MLGEGYDQDRIFFLLKGGWAEFRSVIEQTGNLAGDQVAEVLDLERAITALQHEDPRAALLIVASLHGFTHHEIERAGLKLTEGLFHRGASFLTHYLGGCDPGDCRWCEL